MDIGIGIPNSVRGVTGRDLLEWARKADAAGFSTLASIGAVDYPSYEELTVLAAAGAVTERIKFLTNVLIAPARSAAELAKQANTTDQLTGGRLTLGLGVGWRSGDLTLTGHDFSRRGAIFDEQLADLARAWSGEPLEPGAWEVAPPSVQPRVPLIIGGTTDASIRRVVEHGIGWTAGGLPPDMVADFGGKVRDAWQAAGRAGRPRIVALAYFSLGGTEDASRANLLDYYKRMGDDVATMIADGAMHSPEVIRATIEAFAAAGADELILDPSVATLDQVDRVAEVAFG